MYGLFFGNDNKANNTKNNHINNQPQYYPCGRCRRRLPGAFHPGALCNHCQVLTQNEKRNLQTKQTQTQPAQYNYNYTNKSSCPTCNGNGYKSSAIASTMQCIKCHGKGVISVNGFKAFVTTILSQTIVND